MVGNPQSEDCWSQEPGGGRWTWGPFIPWPGLVPTPSNVTEPSLSLVVLILPPETESPGHPGSSLCVSAVISLTHREAAGPGQRRTAVSAEHACLCEPGYPCVSSARISRALLWAWHLPRGALGVGGSRPTNKYKPWPVLWGPGSCTGLVCQPLLRGRCGHQPPLCFPPSAPSGWRGGRLRRCPPGKDAVVQGRWNWVS